MSDESRWKVEADANVDPRVVEFVQAYVDTDEFNARVQDEYRKRVLGHVNPAHALAYYAGIMKMGAAMSDAWARMQEGVQRANHGFIEMYTYRFKDDRIPAVEPSEATPVFWPPNETLDAWACSREHRDHRRKAHLHPAEVLMWFAMIAVVVIGLYILARAQA